MSSVHPVPGLRVYEMPTGFREGVDGAAFPSREVALRGAREIGEEIRADPSFRVRPPGAGALGTLSPGRREAALSVGSARVAS
ncbi:hypothetical protein ADK94_18280 [Streptomyces sp. XY593]|nr:hypothetical protein ADK94_18280 [Streptomyces sp. XY593]KOV04176.1 hypothetical protein ADK91_16090 [Streptomyces sp. XY511]KOV53326.1 hypothetical protein ADK98_04655 [Streptomyces sp. H036]